MEQEIWKDIIGYEGIYQISSLGRVKSVSRYVNHINGVRHVHSKILKPKHQAELQQCRKSTARLLESSTS